MESSEQKQFEDVINFSNSLVNERKINFQEILNLVEGSIGIYNVEKEKLPYHINIIDELHADENAHSRILPNYCVTKKITNIRFWKNF